MGFFGGLAEGFGVSSGNNRRNKKYDDFQDLFDAVDDSTDDCLTDQAIYSKSYNQQQFRKRTLANSESNHGWYTCPKCGKKFRARQMDGDHIKPKSTGGAYTTENGQLLCIHCNRSKQADKTDTYKDLTRRRNELSKQKKENIEFLKEVEKTIGEDHHKPHHKSNHHSSHHSSYSNKRRK